MKKMNQINIKNKLKNTSLLKLLFFFFCSFILGFNSQAQLKHSPIFLPGVSSILALPNGCNITVNAGPDITICTGVGKTLNGMVNGGFSSYIWEPPDGLSNPDVLNPMANPMSTTTYTLTARGMSPNKFLNGGFESGTIAPSTSSYTMHTNPNTLVMGTGGYMVMSVPQIAAAFGCNPNIGAFAMVISPTAAGTNILCQTIATTPNTDYKISYKVFGIPYILGSPPVIRLRINGVDIGSVPAESGLCVEAEGNFTWNSGASSSANFCFDNTGGTGGFSICALDEISVIECCEETDEVTVTVYDLVADISMPDEISCDNRPMTLDASGSSTGPNITYLWTTTNGKIVSGDKTLRPVIDAPGTYKLKVIGEFGCEQEISVTVSGNVTPPNLTVLKTNIDCKNPLGSIEARSTNPNVNFEWTGPNGYTSSKAVDRNIREPGEYEVTATDDYGCKSTMKVIVDDNRTDVDLLIKGDTIRCGQDSVILKGESVSSRPEFEWTLPGGAKVRSSDIAAKDTGWYKLLVRDSLGCFAIDSFYVFNYKSSVPISLISDTLNCDKPTLIIRYTTDTSGTVLWTGPNGFNSNAKLVMVSDSGWYYISLTTKDGCVGLDSVYIAADLAEPDVMIAPTDTLDCNLTSVNLIGSSSRLDAGFEWTGPTGILGNTATIQVNQGGVYTLIAKLPNGCLASSSISIVQDIDTPSVRLFTDTLNCIKDKIILNVNSDSTLSYDWKGPGGFSSNSAFPEINLPGEYTVVVIGKNGCPRAGSVIISENKEIPYLALQNDTLTCDKTILRPIVNTDLDIVNFNWTGPGGFMSNVIDPAIFIPGLYLLRVTKSNGCEATEAILISEDKILPTAVLSADTITCKTTAEIKVISIDPDVNFNWFGPGGFSSDQLQTPITIGGWYYLQMRGKNGCMNTDSVFVFQKDILPDIFTRDDTLNCAKLSLSLQGGSGTQGVRFEWTGPGGFTSTDPNPVVTDSGIYTLRVIDPNGCEASKNLYISKLGEQPKFQLLQLDSLTCVKNNARIFIQGLSSNDQIQLNGPSGVTIVQDTAIVVQEGFYVFTVTNEYGCVTKDSIFIRDLRSLPDAIVRDDTITCARRSIVLPLNSILQNLNFNWSGPNGFTSTEKNPTINQAGDYTVTITNAANCQLIRTLRIVADTLEPDLVLLADTITCKRNFAPVIAITKSQGFQIQWTGPGGFTYSLPQFSTTIPGIYTATLTFSRNKCTVTKSIEIVEDTGRIRNVEIQKTDIGCGGINGFILIGQVTGGSPGFEYSIDNGLSYVTQNVFNNLPKGIYSVKVKDRNGCEFSIQTQIDSVGGVQIDLIPEIILQEGENATLNLQILNGIKVKTILWSPSNQLSCSDCQNPVLTATEDQTITVEVIDENGCMATTQILVKVIKEVDVFFPNSFSPNGDNINDFFFPVSSSDLIKINHLSIFDRWGANVFNNRNFSVNDPASGWDGKFKGQALMPGVYIYTAELGVGDQIKKYYGEITIIR